MDNQPAPIACLKTLMTLFEATVVAGFPSPAADHAQRRIDLNEYLLIHRDASFLFRVKGDSMKNVGIFDNDTIIVDRSIEPRHGHIVLAVVDHEFTVKRLYQRGKTVKLMPENDAYQPITFKDGQELTVWGVVTVNLRKLL